MAYYATGKWARAMCPRCGHEKKYTSLKREWTGLWVCPSCFDPKHEQIDPLTRIHDPQALEHPWPDNDSDGDPVTQLEDSIEMTFGPGKQDRV